MAQPLAEAVVAWYRQNARDLPWRREVTAYRVLVSEIMLQQTRVEAVKPYFERFLAALPTVEALAAADDETLHKLWQGLGYYSRARNLRRAAIAVCERHGGVIPRTPPELLALPGIGPYTAGAIAAFAYGVPAPAVDGNVLRVISRLLGETGDILSPPVRARLTDAVADLVPADAPSEFGQGLIELGALVCVPNAAPRCELCPLSDACTARRDGSWDEIPYRAPKRPRKIERRTVLVVRSGDRVLLSKRPDRGLLAGLWEFPSLEGDASEADALARVRALGLEPIRIEPTVRAKHIFTHIEWQMTGYLVTVAEPDALPPAPPAPLAMPTIAEIDNSYAIPSAFAKFLRLLH